MKKIFAIEDTLADKISYYHLLLFLILLPFDRFYTELILIGFLIHTLLHLKKENLKRLSLKNILIAQSLFILTLVGIAYSKNTSEAIAITSRQSAIFLFPLLFYLNPLNLNKYRSHFFLAFSFICTATIAFLYFDALRILHYYHLPFTSLFSSAFINHNFSLPIDLHATYLSLYTAISLVYLLSVFYESSDKAKVVLSLAILLLSAGLLQLGSRAVLISTVIISAVFFPFYYLGRRQRTRFLLLLTCVMILAAAGIFQFASLKSRFFNQLRFDLAENTSPLMIENPRMQRWELAWHLVQNAPLKGYGSGDEVDLLKEQYFKNKLYNSYLFGLNAHNEYLSFLITGGVPGLIIYLFTLLYGFRIAFRKKDLLFLSFLILISVVSLSENYLNVNKGIFFYAFFFSFFIRTAAESKENNWRES